MKLLEIKTFSMIERLLKHNAYILLILFASNVYGQQIPITNQFKYNQFIYNPSLSNTKIDKPIFSLMHRKQWVGVLGAPETSLLSYNATSNDGKVGYAMFFNHDKTGIINTTSFYGNYSYNLKVIEDLNISFGLNAGILNKALNFSRINVIDIDDNFYSVTINSGTIFDFNAGFNAKYKDFELGVSIPQILAPSIQYSEANLVTYALQRHYLSSFRYTMTFDVAELGDFGKNMILTPQVITRFIPQVPLQIDAHVMVEAPTLGWLGLGYRIGSFDNSSIFTNLGINISDDFAVGYAFEMGLSKVGRQLGSTHEVSLALKFGNIPKTPKKGIITDEDELEEGEKTTEEKAREENEVLLSDMKKELIKRQDSIAAALRNDIILNANKLITHNDVLTEAEGSKEELLLEDEDSRTMASNVVAGSKGFYVVSNVFGNRLNAEIANAKLVDKGYDVEYFYNRENRFYYVFLRKYKTYQQALDAKNSKLNGSYDGDLWIKEVK